MLMQPQRSVLEEFRERVLLRKCFAERVLRNRGQARGGGRGRGGRNGAAGAKTVGLNAHNN